MLSRVAHRAKHPVCRLSLRRSIFTRRHWGTLGEVEPAARLLFTCSIRHSRSRRQIGQKQTQDHEQGRHDHRGLLQQRRSATRTKNSAAAPTEGRPQAAALARLQQHDDDQKETEKNEKEVEQNEHIRLAYPRGVVPTGGRALTGLQTAARYSMDFPSQRKCERKIPFSSAPPPCNYRVRSLTTAAEFRILSARWSAFIDLRRGSTLMKKWQLFLSLALVAAAILFVVMTYQTTPTTPTASPKTLAFSPYHPDFALIDAAREQWFAPPLQFQANDPTLAWVKKSWQRLSLASLAKTFEHDPDAYHRLQRELESAVVDLLASFGARGHFWAGQTLFERFFNSLTPAPLLSTPAELSALYSPDDPRLNAKLHLANIAACWRHSVAILAYRGDFLHIAQREGWLDPNHHIAERHLPMVNLLFRHLWVNTTMNVSPVGQIMPPEELEAIRRWQLESSQMPPEAKLRLLAELRPGWPSYDSDFAAAVLHHAMGDHAAARDALDRAIDRAQAANASERVQELQAMRASLP